VTFWVFWGASAGELVGGRARFQVNAGWELVEKGNDAASKAGDAVMSEPVPVCLNTYLHVLVAAENF
jgi:hypothetical protein